MEEVFAVASGAKDSGRNGQHASFRSCCHSGCKDFSVNQCPGIDIVLAQRPLGKTVGLCCSLAQRPLGKTVGGRCCCLGTEASEWSCSWELWGFIVAASGENGLNVIKSLKTLTIFFIIQVFTSEVYYFCFYMNFMGPFFRLFFSSSFWDSVSL